MILAGDIGGTKTLLAIYDDNHCVAKHTFASANYSTFHSLLAEFLTLIPSVRIDKVCIGVAGAIVNGNCETTNLPWKLVCDEVGQQLDCSQIKLLNDLETAAWGVLSLPETDFVDLNPHANKKQGNCAVVAAGTGLGEAIVFHDGNKHHVIATEGGHCDFAPTDSQQMALLAFMQARFKNHVSYERLVSGAGIEAIYDFLNQTNEYPFSETLEQKLNHSNDKAAIIGATAVAETDELCVATLELFSKIYGAEAGNLALKCLPHGGIYLTGGIGLKCLSILQKGAFLESFLAKGRFRSMLEKIPVKVCTQAEVVLLGALHHARMMTS